MNEFAFCFCSDKQRGARRAHRSGDALHRLVHERAAPRANDLLDSAAKNAAGRRQLEKGGGERCRLKIVELKLPFECTKPLVQPTRNHQHVLVAGNAAELGTIYMLHVASQHLFKTFVGHTDRVTAFCTSSSGAFFTSTSFDGSVRIWNMLQVGTFKTGWWPTFIR